MVAARGLPPNKSFGNFVQFVFFLEKVRLWVLAVAWLVLLFKFWYLSTSVGIEALCLCGPTRLQLLKTPPTTQRTINPKFNFQKTFTVVVTEEFQRWVSNAEWRYC